VIRLFVTGFLQVSLVAAGTVFQSHFNYLPAFLNGFAISAVWWFNARSAGRAKQPLAFLAYALGAATGTIAGMKIASVLV
jgi:hypothetical protein